MARIDWVRQKLENWARWSAQSEAGGLGYPKQSPFARMVAGGTNDGIPVSNLDAAEVEEAVQSLQLTKSHLYLTLKWHYGKGYTIDRVSTRLHKAPSTIKRHLEDADHAIAAWIEARREARVAAGGRPPETS